MTALLSAEQVQTARMFVFKTGRLLERQLFEYFFGSGVKAACLKALEAYQNADGGFGNALEPDIACPASSGIGAETALFVLDVLEEGGGEIAARVAGWAAAAQNAQGVIAHPPAGFERYPCQSWWQQPDPQRVLSLAGMLKKWGLGETTFFERARRAAADLPAPAEIRFYDYPYFVYLKHCRAGAAEEARFAAMLADLPGLIQKAEDHFPLFNRAWYAAAEFVEPETLAQQAARFVSAIHPDGDIDSPYPQFPSWNPIYLLDGLIMLRRFGFL